MPGTIVAPYSTSVVSGFDLHKPEFMTTLIQRYGDQGRSFFQTLIAMGFEMTVSQFEYHHFEDDWITDFVIVRNNVAAGAAGADTTFEIAAASLDANNRFYLRKNDRIFFPNLVLARVVDIDVSTPADPIVTLRPVSQTDAIPALTAGDKLAIGDNAFSDGSGQPAPAFRGTIKYDNQTGIIKESIRGYGGEMTNQVWVETVDGKGIKCWFDVASQIDIDFRMIKRISASYLTSKLATNPDIDPDTGEQIRSTEGMFPYMNRVSTPFVSTPGMESIYDFDEFDSILQASYVGPRVLCLFAENIYRAYENKLVDYFKHTDISYVTKEINDELFGGDTALAATVNFRSLVKSNRTYMFKRFTEMSDPKSFGIPGYPMKNFGLILPLDRMRKDAKSGKLMPNVGIRWKGLGAYSRKMETFELGSANIAVPTNEFDRKDMYQRCEYGAHFMAGNQWIFVKP